jgi:sialidase-1
MNQETVKLIFSKIMILLVISIGIIITLIPIVFWDFLVTYQFKPTVRPYYPIFYGSIFSLGIIIIFLGGVGLRKKNTQKLIDGKGKGIMIVLSLLTIAFGLIIQSVTTDLFKTTLYLSADNLFNLILTGLILGILFAICFGFNGLFTIYSIIKKRPIDKIVQLINFIPLLMILIMGLIGGVLFLPPDVDCQEFPVGLYHTTIYKQGDSGYHTFKIPTMITAENGTILAFAEARVDNQEDWGKMDMVLRKSYDGGNTWTPLEVVVEEGNLTIGNTCPVVDGSTGFIWVLFCKENDICFKMHSEDNGETWSTPIEITKDIKLEGWTWYAFGPTHGIQLEDGTLMIPADHIEGYKMYSHVVYSTDHGTTWELGGNVPGGEEATIVELENGDIYLNTRPVRPGYRLTAISEDKGKTWKNITFDTALPDPACQGNLIEMDNPDSPGESIYLFSNSADKIHREKMTVRISYDECKTWEYSKILYPGMTSYSDLSLINSTTNTIGCLFEKGCNYYAEEIVFTRFSLDYIKS